MLPSQLEVVQPLLREVVRLQVEGVEGFFSAKDVPGHDIVPGTVPGSNQMGSVMHDEEVFALDEVKCVGQVWPSPTIKRSPPLTLHVWQTSLKGDLA